MRAYHHNRDKLSKAIEHCIAIDSHVSLSEQSVDPPVDGEPVQIPWRWLFLSTLAMHGAICYLCLYSSADILRAEVVLRLR